MPVRISDYLSLPAPRNHIDSRPIEQFQKLFSVKNDRMPKTKDTWVDVVDVDKGNVCTEKKV